MKAFTKTKILSIISCFFLSFNSFSQSQIYSENYKGCIKEQFDSNFVDNIIFSYQDIFQHLQNNISILTEEELKPIKEEYDKIYGKILYNISYLNSIPKSYPISDKTTKNSVCQLYFERSDISQRIVPIQNYCSRIYQDKELKNYARERLSRQ